MTLQELYQRLEQERSKARSMKQSFDPRDANFRYYQGRQDAFQQCLDVLREVAE